MGVFPYQNLQNDLVLLRSKLKEAGQLLLTDEGKPFAVMIDTPDDEDLDELLLQISRLRAQMAVRSIRNQARADGLDNLGEEQVDDLIQETREDRDQ